MNQSREISVDAAVMNSNEWESPDYLLSMKWPKSTSAQPLYSAYINECGDPVEPRFGESPGWNQFYMRPEESKSFYKGPHISSPIAWNSDMDPIPLLVEQHVTRNESGIPQRLSEEDKGHRYMNTLDSVAEDCGTPQVVLSPTAKNSYRPAWKSPLGDQDSGETTNSTHTKKRQKVSVRADEGSPSFEDTPEQTRRRSQRKPSLSVKSSQPYTSPSTESSSPVRQASRSCSDIKIKKSHNLTEKKYRNRLNGFFDSLLSAIPRRSDNLDDDHNGDVPEKKVSKGEVLVLALEHIRGMERQVEALEKEKMTLTADLERAKACSAGSSSK